MDCTLFHLGLSSSITRQKFLQTSSFKHKGEFVCCDISVHCVRTQSFLFFRCTSHFQKDSVLLGPVLIMSSFFPASLSSCYLAGRINHQDFTLPLGDLVQRQQRFVLWWQVKWTTNRRADRRSDGSPLHGAARPEI